MHTATSLTTSPPLADLVSVTRHLPAGYSHRQTPTAKAGEYLAAWVQGPKNGEDIYYRFIKR